MAQTLGAPDTRGTGNQPIFIGAGDGEYFDGTIDDVRVYNRALSVAEIQNMYSAQK